jgi:Flp pilus assembly protein TadD
MAGNCYRLPVALLVALLTTGCLGIPPRAPSPDPPPPQAPRDSQPAGGLDLAQEDRDGRNESRATATPRQKFQVHIDFGRIFESQGNFEGAINEYQDALTVIAQRHHAGLNSADEALAHRRMAGAMDRLGRFAQAEDHYKRALRLSHKDPRIWNDVGYSYYLQGRFAEASTALETAHKLAPDDERIRTNLGLALAAAGRSQEALQLLSQSTGDAVGHANLGYLLAATGQPDLARQQYESALALRPDMDLARRALGQLDRQQKGAALTAVPPTQVAGNSSPPPPQVDSNVQKVSPAEDPPPPLPPPPKPWPRGNSTQ